MEALRLLAWSFVAVVADHVRFHTLVSIYPEKSRICPRQSRISTEQSQVIHKLMHFEIMILPLLCGYHQGVISSRSERSRVFLHCRSMLVSAGWYRRCW